MNQLKVTIDLEDYTAGLIGHLSVNRFTGYGDGWFNLTEINQFCGSLEDLATSMKGSPELIAGQSKVDGSNYLETFGLRSYVLSKTGIIGMHVTLADPPYTDCRKEEIYKVSGELKVEVQSLLSFINQLKQLCNGEIKEAVLHGRE